MHMQGRAEKCAILKHLLNESPLILPNYLFSSENGKKYILENELRKKICSFKTKCIIFKRYVSS